MTRPAVLGRPTPIVRDRRHVADRADLQPAVASAWIADSRPEPGPCTRTCTRRTPRFIASRPPARPPPWRRTESTSSSPGNPPCRGSQVRVLPCMSVIVMSVLLKRRRDVAMPSPRPPSCALRAAPWLVPFTFSGGASSCRIGAAALLVRALVCVRWRAPADSSGGAYRDRCDVHQRLMFIATRSATRPRPCSPLDHCRRRATSASRRSRTRASD